jgi:hypothetical protein
MKERRSAVRQFASHIDGAVHTLIVLRKRELWLQDYQHEFTDKRKHAPRKYVFADGRDFQEERAFYDSAVQRLAGSANPPMDY